MSKSLEVLELLKKVPQGKVTTYGALAKAAHTSPRAVGQIMRRNPSPKKYPCYKVVSSSGRVHGYAGCLAGKNVEKKLALLKKDGIIIKSEKIDLEKFGYKFSV
jgi:methylated-DNA-[protein]-cysteine S-methyltransferase